MEVNQEQIDIQEKLNVLINEIFPRAPKDIAQNTSLIKDLDADSLDMVDFILALEDTFNIEILDEEIESLSTLDSIEKYIKRKLFS